MIQFDQSLAQYRAAFEAYIETFGSNASKEPQEMLFAAMRYSLLAGGKRLRPIFVFDFCRMCGGDWTLAMPFAAAVEMIHTYSLIHDDLPCMDNDDYRRGRLTNHKVYGEAMAVLAGDALQAAAFSSLADAADLSPETRLQAVSVLASCSGCFGMVGGQVLDMEAESRACTEQEVLDIQTRKTGALIRAACQLGVVAGGGTAAQMESAARFAGHIGLAFQIRDDMLDAIGDPKALGKAVGADANKNTFVRLYGLERCRQLVRSHSEAAVSCLDTFVQTDFMQDLTMRLIERNS